MKQSDFSCQSVNNYYKALETMAAYRSDEDSLVIFLGGINQVFHIFLSYFPLIFVVLLLSFFCPSYCPLPPDLPDPCPGVPGPSPAGRGRLRHPRQGGHPLGHPPGGSLPHDST